MRGTWIPVGLRWKRISNRSGWASRFGRAPRVRPYPTDLHTRDQAESGHDINIIEAGRTAGRLAVIALESLTLEIISWHCHPHRRLTSRTQVDFRLVGAGDPH